MASKDKRLLQLASAVEPVMRREGFSLCETALDNLIYFGKEVCDIKLCVVLEAGKGSNRAHLNLVVSFRVYSEPLVKMLHGPEKDRPWFSAPAFSHLSRVLDAAKGVEIRDQNDLDRVANELPIHIEQDGLPFLSSFGSTDDLVQELRRGGPHVTRPELKAHYDADVWEGKIDPKTEPFVPREHPLVAKLREQWRADGTLVEDKLPSSQRTPPG